MESHYGTLRYNVSKTRELGDICFIIKREREREEEEEERERERRRRRREKERGREES